MKRVVSLGMVVAAGCLLLSQAAVAANGRITISNHTQNEDVRFVVVERTLKSNIPDEGYLNPQTETLDRDVQFDNRTTNGVAVAAQLVHADDPSYQEPLCLVRVNGKRQGEFIMGGPGDPNNGSDFECQLDIRGGVVKLGVYPKVLTAQ